MKRILIFVLLAVMALSGFVVTAQECDDAIGCVEIGADEPIHIAYMLTISGATAFLGEDSLGGIEIAIDDRGGELLGHPIELSGEDSLCNPEGGQAAAQKVTSDDTVLGIIGTNCSGASFGALPIVSSAGMVMISSSATNPNLTNEDVETDGVWQPGFYRTAHNDDFQGAADARFAIGELGASTLATIHDGSPYAEALQGVMADVFTELGGEVVFQGSVNVGDTDMSSILSEIALEEPDVLFFPIFEPEGNLIADQAKVTPGLEDTILFGADGLFVDGFPERTGEASINMYLSGPNISGEAYDEFLATWEEKYGGGPPSGFHAHAYDATNLLLNAIESVAVETDDGGLLVGRQALRDALTNTVDYDGMTGPLTCTDHGECASGESLGIFVITEELYNAGEWPPDLVWTP